MYMLFTSQHNFVMESGVHSSLHQNCHYQIIYAKINLKVCYLPLYERVIRHYQGEIKFNKQLNSFLWEKLFRNLNINKTVSLFNRTIKDIPSNYIPHETIFCDDRDPPWINSNMKQLTQDKNNAYKGYILGYKNPQIFDRVKSLQNQLKCLIEVNKEKYYLRKSKKLMDPITSAKN